MLPEPLHPLLIHFPIALTALLLPMAIYGSITGHRRPKKPVWISVTTLAALTLATALLAQRTGDREEDRVEPWVGEAALELHEEHAERFVWSLGIVFGCSLIGLAAGGVGRAGRVLTVATLLPAAALLVLVGGSGGDLVYKHGAAAAYTNPVSGPQVQRGSVHQDD